LLLPYDYYRFGCYYDLLYIMYLSDDNTRNDVSACNIIGAFVNQVNANERRGTLTADLADHLRTQGEDIRSKLYC
jgi:hypothetical protein